VSKQLFVAYEATCAAKKQDKVNAKNAASKHKVTVKDTSRALKNGKGDNDKPASSIGMTHGKLV
jgi:hypothetical protein